MLGRDTAADEALCKSCGACCDYSADWPRFWTDSDEDIARLPANLVAEDGNAMACDGNRCKALIGIVGEAVHCSVYLIRPEVCHACLPGDDACAMAREHHGLPPLTT
jgi:Fe-S-cluster containining protein